MPETASETAYRELAGYGESVLAYLRLLDTEDQENPA